MGSLPSFGVLPDEEGESTQKQNTGLFRETEMFRDSSLKKVRKWISILFICQNFPLFYTSFDLSTVGESVHLFFLLLVSRLAKKKKKIKT